MTLSTETNFRMPVTWNEIDAIRVLYNHHYTTNKQIKLSDEERKVCEEHPHFINQTGNFVHVPPIRGKVTIRCQYVYDNFFVPFFRTCCAGLNLTRSGGDGGGARLAMGFSFIAQNEHTNEKICIIPSKLTQNTTQNNLDQYDAPFVSTIESHIELARFFDTVERMDERQLLESHFSLLENEKTHQQHTKPVRSGIFLYLFLNKK